LVNILERAVSTYWAEIIRHDDSNVILAGQGVIVIKDTEDDGKIYMFDRYNLKKGVQIIFEKYPHLVEQIVNDTNTDMYTGDFIIQCGIFGELKYS
jgi:formaldehyde-activating enzyme involved in methanogenesis